ncbi:MAG: hypothetical protein ACK5A0_05095 [Polaromonas sp.]|jgi:hypothetical protein
MYIMLSNGWMSAKVGFVLAVLVWSGAAPAQSTPTNTADLSATELLDKHASLASQLKNNAFGRPLYLDSVQTSSRVTGNAYAVLDGPFALVSSSVKDPKQLCDLIILHINTKNCRPTLPSSPGVLMVNIGKKTAQTLGDTFALEFAMSTSASSAHFAQVQLNAEKGPLGTRHYRIELAAVPLPDGKTFLHLRYSYDFGLTGHMAMQAYLATAGSSKLGFTQTAQAGGGQKTYVGGMRGAVERNTMRYYLAIEAYLLSLGAPPADQQNTRLEKWFDSTEQYPLQLHETDKASYLTMKKDEIRRQQSALPGLP